ncbi:MAG: T9SS type A sorting domain-containing protein [Ignavibacteriales bacterium]|nr:T9SS type A sorting domain-containing protein [Ignavibacteriales bacterium]
MKIFIVFSIFIFLFSDSNAQTDSCAIQWEPPIQISNSSCDSYSPQIIVIGDTIHIFWTGAYTTGCDPSDLDSQYSYSFDGGRTFSIHRQLIHPDSTGGGHLTSASGKNLYLYYLARVDSPLWWACAILRSTDAGVTWERRQVLGDYSTFSIASMDSLVFLYVDDSSRDTLYSAILASSDNGSTWGFRCKRLPFAHQTNPKGLIATKTGLHMVFADYFQAGDIGYAEIVYLHSTDLGFTWSDPQILSTKDSIISQLPAIGGDDNGNLYSIWNDGKYGGEWAGTIIMRRSTDNGITWLPEQIMSPLATAVYCDVAVEDSTVVVTWETDSTYAWYIHTRMSKDFGNNWCPIIQSASLSRRTGDPVASISNDIIHLAWDNDINSRSQIFYQSSNLITNTATEKHPSPQNFSLHQNFPNPLNSSTRIKYKLPQEDYVRIEIFDIFGRTNETLINQKQPAGEFEIEWKADNKASGIYFYRIITSKYTETKKLLLIR